MRDDQAQSTTPASIVGAAVKEQPFAAFSPQAKLICALVLILGIVIGAPYSSAIVVAIVLLIVLLAIIAQAKIARMLLKSLVVLPVAGMLSLFLPLRYLESWSIEAIQEVYIAHWPQMLALVITPWLCVLVMMFLIEICPRVELIHALEKLHVPHILVMLLSFMYRYIDVMHAQLIAARRSLVSRAPAMGPRRQVFLYGNLAGSMLIRAYDRGERIYAAMLSRGYCEVLPVLHDKRFGGVDILLVSCSVLFALALILV